MAAEAGKITVTEVLSNALKNILTGVMVEAVTTSIIGVFSQQDYSNEHIDVATSKLLH